MLKSHLVEQGSAYLVTGIILSVSHHFHTYPAVVFFGHLLVAVSFIIVISVALNYKWMRRIASPLDILSGTTLMITFAADIVLFIVDELQYYTQSKILPQNLVDSLFVTILLSVVAWLFVLALPLMLLSIDRRQPSRTRLLSFILVVALALVVADGLLKVFPLQNVVLVVLVAMIAIIVISQRERPKWTSSLIYSSHLFSVLAMAFAFGGILSTFTRAAPPMWFWESFVASGFGFTASALLLRGWRRRLVRTVLGFLSRGFSRLTTSLKGARLMSRMGTGIAVAGLVVVTIAVAVLAAKGTGKLADAFIPGLTAALVWVTGYYAIATAKLLEATNRGVQVAAQQANTVSTQTQIMLNAEYNAAAPVVSLQANVNLQENETEVTVIFNNIGKGPALNFRCWIEDPNHQELRSHKRSIFRTALENSGRISTEGHINIDIRDYRLGSGFLKAQYESVFGKTYESRLMYPANVEPQLEYGEVKDEKEIIRL